MAAAPGPSAIDGDTVAWSDNSHSAHIGIIAEGCHNLPDRRCDIYLYNLATGEEKLLAQTVSNNVSPSITGDMATYPSYSS